MGSWAVVRKADYMTPNQMKRSLKSLGLYIRGYSWKQIKQEGGYSWAVFSAMMAAYPDLSKAYQEARKTSGQAFEDKALDLAGKLVAPNDFSGTNVRAYEVAMNQYRWSASRRDPASYAEAGANKISVVVPVQINSSLNLAEPGAKEEQAVETIWEVQTRVLEASEAPPEADDDLGVPEDQPEPETAPSGLPVALEEVREALGLPLEVPKAVKRRPSPGRPRLKHKTKVQTGATATAYGRMNKSPSVRAALGIKEAMDEPIVDVGDKSTGSGSGRE